MRVAWPTSSLLRVLFLVHLQHTVVVHAGECLNTVFLIVTFGLGGIVNQQCAEPKCHDGVRRLLLGNDLEDQENCDSCLADVEDFPNIKGVAGCTSTRVFCIQDDLCGDARTSMTFAKHGDLDVDEDLYAYFFTSAPDVYELRVIAVPQNQEDI